MTAAPKMIERIRRCLALGAGTSPEAETARAKARLLATQHGVDIDAIERERKTPVSTVAQTVYTPKSTALWRAALAWGITNYVNVEMIRLSGRRKGAFSVIGTPEDFATWRTLYERAEADIDAEAIRYLNDEVRDDWSRNAKSAGDAFRKGAANGFRDRLVEYKREAERSAQGQATQRLIDEAAARAATAEGGGATGITQRAGTGLVLVSRTLAVQAAKKVFHPKTTTQKISRSRDSSARADGYAYGRSLGVHKGNIGGGR